MDKLRRHLVVRVSRLVRRPEDADDAAQEAIVRLLAARQRGCTVRNEQAFAMRTAIRVAIDRRRQLNGQARHLRGASIAARTGVNEPAPPEDVQRLYDAIAALPAKQAAVITLRKLMELEYADVAAVLGISQDSCRTHCKLGLRRLRALLGDEETSS